MPSSDLPAVLVDEELGLVQCGDLLAEDIHCEAGVLGAHPTHQKNGAVNVRAGDVTLGDPSDDETGGERHHGHNDSSEQAHLTAAGSGKPSQLLMTSSALDHGVLAHRVRLEA